MSKSFDPNIPPTPGGLAFEGDFTGTVVITEQPTIGESNLVVVCDRPFDIEVSWHVFGNAVPLFLATLSASSPNWAVKAYAESEGPGDEKLLAKLDVPVAGLTPDGMRTRPPFTADEPYTAKLTVPASTLSAETDDGTQSGTYKIIVTTFLGGPGAPTGFEIMGYAEGPIIKVVNP